MESEKSKRINLSNYAAGFIAIISLAVALWTAYESRLSNRISVTPKLELSAVDEDSGKFIYATNKGIGPAELIQAELRYNNKPIESLPKLGIGKYYNLTPQQLAQPIIAFESFTPGHFIALDGEEKIVELVITTLQDFNLKDLEITLTYKSIYGEVFQDSF